jgi:hypothetical protein
MKFLPVSGVLLASVLALCAQEKKKKSGTPPRALAVLPAIPAHTSAVILEEILLNLNKRGFPDTICSGIPYFFPRLAAWYAAVAFWVNQSAGTAAHSPARRAAHVQKHSRTGRLRMTTVHLLRSQPAPINVSQSHFPARASSRSQKQKDCTRATQEPRMQRPTHSALLILRRDTAHVALPGWCKEGLRHPKLRALRN